jgi:glycopeptide antibiotics resistance protein
MARNVALLASVALSAALTLRPGGGDSLFQVSQLGDIVDALRRSDKPFLLDSLLEAGANILLFLPFGAALWLRGFSIGTAALYGFALSAVVEAAQWFVISGRTTSLDDVALNTLGAVLGQALASRSMPGRVPAREDPTSYESAIAERIMRS